ncbi:hypothetical protein D031_2382A, partial [Vibrio parahaemolyticus VP-48]
MYLRKPSF